MLQMLTDMIHFVNSFIIVLYVCAYDLLTGRTLTYISPLP